MPFSQTLAMYPIHDKDSKSSKNEDKLRERHLSEGQTTTEWRERQNKCSQLH
jgi:hypothetical protein